jgi:hypothetical protein
MEQLPENIKNRLAPSFDKSIALLDKIYYNEALFLAKSDQKYSDRAHKAKDELMEELDPFTGIMSLKLNTRTGSTRKRSRANSVRRLNNNRNIPPGQG